MMTAFVIRSDLINWIARHVVHLNARDNISLVIVLTRRQPYRVASCETLPDAKEIR